MPINITADQVYRRLEAAFGVAVRRAFIPRNYPPVDIPDRDEPTQLDNPHSDYKGQLGNAIFDRLEVLGGTGLPRGFDGEPVNVEPYTFTIDPLIDIRRRKKISETVMVAKEDTVKEIIAVESYRVRIRGLIVGENGNYPNDELTALNNLCNTNASLEVSSRLLNTYGISNLVIKEFNSSAVAGYPDTRAVEIQALSDFPDEAYFEEILQ